MNEWTRDELSRIGTADELEVAPLRPDGSLGRPVTIWVVPHEDGLYVRSFKGASAGWFRGAQARHEGRIRAGGVEKDVTFMDADHSVDEAVDAGYRAKYRRYGDRMVDPMMTPEARSSTIRLVPR
jgi:hypothetical protein